MAYRIIFTGVKGLAAKFKKLGGGALKSALEDGVRLTSHYVFGELKMRTPVDTGFMKGTEEMLDIDSLTTEIYPTAYYSFWVEHGHHTTNGGWVEGQFFVRATYNYTKPKATKIMKYAVQKAISKTM